MILLLINRDGLRIAQKESFYAINSFGSQKDAPGREALRA